MTTVERKPGKLPAREARYARKKPRAQIAAAPFNNKDTAKYAPVVRAIGVVDKVLATRPDIWARTVTAFARAVAVTPPGSEHGQVLLATLKSLAAQDPGSRLTDLPPEQTTVAWLAFRGMTPTASAAEHKTAELARHDERLQRSAEDIAAIVAESGPRAAQFTAGVLERSGAGPLWSELASLWGLSWQDRPVVIRALARDGWLTFEEGVERSLRPGPRYLDTTNTNTTAAFAAAN